MLFKELSCLNFRPSSEPGVNKGLGLLFFLFRFQLLFLSLSFCLCICILSLLRQKTQTAQWYFSVGNIPLCCISQGTPPFVSPSPPQELVVSRRGLGNHLCFFCPGHFRAGNIHNKLSFWHEKLPCFEVIRVEFTLTASSTHSGGISKDMRNT